MGRSIPYENKRRIGQGFGSGFRPRLLQRFTTSLALLLAFMYSPAVSGRQQKAETTRRSKASAIPVKEQEKPILLETGPFDPPGWAKANQTSLPMKAGLGGLVSIQANVDFNGNNIVGDAANEPSLAVDPTNPNRIAVGWRQFDTITSNFRQAGTSFSRDGGRTWSGMTIIEPGFFRSDPVLTSGPDGTFYYMSLGIPGGQFLEDMFISTDGGETWPTKVFVFGGDKSWFAIDMTGGIGDGNIYQAWNIAGNEFFPNQFNRSVDAGLSWENPVEYEPGVSSPVRPVFGQVAVGISGEVFVAGSLNSANTGTFWVVRSSDAQDAMITPTFDQITTVNMGGNLRIATGPNPAGLLGQVNIAIDHSGGVNHGNVYVLASVDPPNSDPLDVMFIRSTDGGATFSAPVRVNDDAIGNSAWQWFGTMAVAPNGRIDVVWNDTRISRVTDVSTLFYSYSTDGGATWAINIPVSPAFNSFVGWPQQNKLGDYYDMVSDNLGAHLIWAATFNGEQDVYYLRIGDYDCNLNGIGDTEDIALMTSTDCNLNGIPDECEIAAGMSQDANFDGIPDGCDADCDNNGVPDYLEILQGIHEDCNLNTIPDVCDIDDRTSRDCDGSGVPDECEIASGFHADVNADGIPDACQDCNENGVLDPDDLAAGTSRDCNLSGIPDECETSDRNGNGIPDFCEDCNNNLVADHIDISSGFSNDGNGNTIPDECDQPGDVNNDLLVNVTDLLDLLANWGLCFGFPCLGDLNFNGAVDVTDLLIVLNNWGS